MKKFLIAMFIGLSTVIIGCYKEPTVITGEIKEIYNKNAIWSNYIEIDSNGDVLKLKCGQSTVEAFTNSKGSRVIATYDSEFNIVDIELIGNVK